jgi:hypothetical protein
MQSVPNRPLHKPMNVLGRSLTLSSLGLGLVFGLAACSGGSGSSGGSMFIETCTLGCGSGQGGTQVSCQFDQAAVNQEIAVFFSEPVDPSSISSASFQIIDVTSGASPNGTRFRDPNNPNKVLFRPAVSFESDGTISFGFDLDATYRVLVPGTSQGDTGPFIRSMGGASNTSRLSCDIQTTQSAVDLVPGPPTVEIFVKQAIPATPDVDDFIPNVPVTADPTVDDVWRGSDIRFVFNDLMNPATLANPVTGDASFVTVEVDLDGNLATSDRTTLFGTYAVQLDPIQLRTTMIFTPVEGMPSSGSLDPLIDDNGLPRQVVVTVPVELQDVAGNALANPTAAGFVPEFVELAAVTLPDADGEDFANTANQDVSHSGAGPTATPVWANGRLTRGQGGGRGRLGELIVTTGTTLTLDTDSTTFPLSLIGAHDLLTNEAPGVDYDPLDVMDWPTITVTDGVFEFTSVLVESNATLRFTGSQPPRLLVRGNVNILGTIDISGSSPADWDSTSSLGQPGAAGGPAAGAGGIGGTRFDFTAPNTMLSVGGVDLPPGEEVVDGTAGQGVGGLDFVASGFGGLHWPTATPLDRSLAPPANNDLHISNVPPNGTCQSVQSGRPGGGGAYGTNGFGGTPMSSVAMSLDGFPNLAGPGEGGGGPSDNSALMIEPPGSPPLVRRLAFEAGNLRGGSGGGGGGASIYGTESDGFSGFCGLGSTSVVNFWRDHSGAGGGGGGGALQLVCGGASFLSSGQIDAGGGNGGSSLPAVAGDTEESQFRTKRAMPGGGGSGGAIRIQATNFPTSALSISLPPRLDVAGGTGGSNTHMARGGDGGAGLIRLEGLNTTPDPAAVAPLLLPTDVGIVGPDAENILSVGSWNLPRQRPESYSGAVSCWMRPSGSFFQLVFLPDSPGAPVPAERFGWDMNVQYAGQTFSYRDPMNSPFAGESIEQHFGNQFDGPAPGSYVVVRFQGARAAGDITDLCNVDPAMGLVPGSLTPWVTNPSDLNEFSPQPNLIRFSVTFDFAASISNPQNQIQGVTGLKIRVQPD